MANEEQLEKLKNELEDLKGKVNKLQDQRLTYPMSKKDRDILKRSIDFLEVEDGVDGGYLSSGNAFMTGFDLSVLDEPLANRMLLLTGPEKEGGGRSDTSKNTHITIEDQAITNSSTNQSFFYGFRSPLYLNDGQSITSGQSTLQDGKFNWDTDELKGAYVFVTGVVSEDPEQIGIIDAFQIASNTSDTITIDGTWSESNADVEYQVFMPVYLGAANFPWRRLYVGDSVGGGIRFGYGATNGGQNTLLYSDDGELKYRDKDGNSSTVGASAPTVRVYTSDDTWSKPSGLSYVEVIAIGSGGGGGGGSGTSGGGSDSGEDGGDGESSSFSTLTALGGFGGIGGARGTAANNPRDGEVSSNGGQGSGSVGGDDSTGQNGLGGEIRRDIFTADELSSSESVTVGQGGTGGPAGGGAESGSPGGDGVVIVKEY